MQGDTECAACGEALRPANGNHHCDERKIARIEAGRKSAESERRPSWSKRFADGMRMFPKP